MKVSIVEGLNSGVLYSHQPRSFLPWAAMTRDRSYFETPRSNWIGRRGSGFLPDYYLRHFLDHVCQKRPRKRNRRIYISRSRSNARRVLNEEPLLTGLRRLGFESYSLENLPVSDQIELFHDAEMVVAAHDAGLVNLLFAENNKVLELFPGPLLRPHYYFLCKGPRLLEPAIAILRICCLNEESDRSPKRCLSKSVPRFTLRRERIPTSRRVPECPRPMMTQDDRVARNSAFSGIMGKEVMTGYGLILSLTQVIESMSKPIPFYLKYPDENITKRRDKDL